MTPRWETMAQDVPGEGPVFMNAELRPNRALSVSAFTILIVMFCTLNAAMAIAFWMQGAWPVIGFLALDVALLYGAFKINYRDGRALERVHVSVDRVVLTRTDPKGASKYFQVHPAWARIEMSSQAVIVSAGGSRQTMATFLSPPERERFSAALEAAVAKARTYRPST